MAAANADYPFTLIYVGDSKRQSDRRVFSASNLAFVLKNRKLSIPHPRKVVAIHSVSNKAFSHIPFLIKSFTRHALVLLKQDR